MIDLMLSLSTWAGCAVAMVFTIVAGFACYLVFFKLITRYKREDIADPIGNLFRVVGMLVSLMLALAFSDVIVELRTIRNAVYQETAAISDIFDESKLYGAELTREIRILLVNYSRAVIEDDWPALANDRLGQRAGALKLKLTEEVKALRPANPFQEKLLSYIMTDIDKLSDYRAIRLSSALATPPV